MKKNITLTFSKFRYDFEVSDIMEAHNFIKQLDNFKVLNNLHYGSHFLDDGNCFIQFEATIKAKKTLYIMNNLLSLYFRWSNFLKVSTYKSDLLNHIANWTLNIEVKE